MKRVAVLGEGVTARAVLSKLDYLNYSASSIEEADLIIASPGIPPSDYPKVTVPIISEIEFTYLEMRDRGTLPKIIAVTGTNGKSTVTAMIAHVLGCNYAGNIGVPFVEFIDKQVDTLALELSSFQLESCFEFCPDIAVILNISPDHLSRHHTLSDYMEAKARLFQNMGPDQRIVYNQDDPLVLTCIDGVGAKKLSFSFSKDLEGVLTRLPGRHNIMNASAVVTVGASCGYSEQKCRDQLNSFQGLAHRLEWVGEYDGVMYINDSKATNLDATINAIRSFNQALHVILCGQDKRDVSDSQVKLFLSAVETRSSKVYVYGDLAQRYKSFVTDSKKVLFFKDLDAVMAAIKVGVTAGDVVLFSPSSSSYDLYKSFEHRGDEFKRRVCL
ncbi:UDP-N-acetylmuramoyl-L-alanine--D-glutamate ligase [Candidatus Marinamargulisbacteria bacterium SCGC AAA071-K20]|nr:UDP-N-acetylmuramoyl-L-alanine--D-glutamate ligase [Candidatus Marinamargulisbacteria bacterium SCGC AAA071-K20]